MTTKEDSLANRTSSLRQRLCTSLLTICLACSIGTVSASDLDKEKRWADQIVDSLLDGEAVYLNDGVSDVLAIYTASETEASRGIIVVHGTGVHPDWEQVVQPVRVEMTTHGWNTLSIQMPILVNEATYEQYIPLYPEVLPRLQAAEKYLRDQGNDTITIVAHSRGAAMSAYYLARAKHNVSAFVAIGLTASQADADTNAANSLEKINIPILDLYGSDDLESVLESVEKRRAATSKNPAFQEIVVDEANHFFDDHADVLIEKIASWLKPI